MSSYASGIPQPLDVVFEHLRNDVLESRFRWGIWKALFRTGDSERALMDWAAPTFFHAVFKVFFADVCLAVCRFLDKESQGSNENLTAEHLLSASAGVVPSAVHDRMRARLDEARSRAKRIRVLRSKYLAHRDRAHAFDDLLAQKALVRYDEVDAVLTLVAEMLNDVESHFKQSTTAYEFLIDPGPGQLLGKLRKAQKWEALPPELKRQPRGEA